MKKRNDDELPPPEVVTEFLAELDREATIYAAEVLAELRRFDLGDIDADPDQNDWIRVERRRKARREITRRARRKPLA